MKISKFSIILLGIISLNEIMYSGANKELNILKSPGDYERERERVTHAF